MTIIFSSINVAYDFDGVLFRSLHFRKHDLKTVRWNQ